MIVKSVEGLVGSTPVYSYMYGGSEILVKLECFNPGGSIKDRAALAMIDDAEKSGKLKPGGVIIEPTSGNMGVGLAMIGVSRGYRVIIVMPDSMSIERRKLLSAFGAELVLTDGALRMSGAIEKAQELVKTIKGAFMPMQFENPANPEIHEITTAEEIIKDTEGRLTAFVASTGTGGTFTGVSRKLKKRLPGIICAAVEPFESAILSGEKAGQHNIQGIGPDFVPQTLDTAIIDKIIKIKTKDAFECARTMAAKRGLLVGISSGAAICAAQRLAEELPKGSRILCIAPDTGERYLSVLF